MTVIRNQTGLHLHQMAMSYGRQTGPEPLVFPLWLFIADNTCSSFFQTSSVVPGPFWYR